jgi:hypothetical protein
VREAAETESGRPIEGFSVQLSPDEARLYNTESFDLAPAAGIQQILSELQAVLEELHSDRHDNDRRNG